MKAFGEVRDRALALVAKVLSECREPCLRVARGGLSKEMERDGARGFLRARTHRGARELMEVAALCMKEDGRRQGENGRHGRIADNEDVGGHSLQQL